MALIRIWRQRMLAAAGATLIVPVTLMVAAGLLAGGGLGGVGSLGQVASGPATPDTMLDRPTASPLARAQVVGDRRPTDLAATPASARAEATAGSGPSQAPGRGGTAPDVAPRTMSVPVTETAPAAPRRTKTPGRATPRRSAPTPSAPPTSSRPIAPVEVNPGPDVSPAPVVPTPRRGPIDQVLDDTRGVIEGLPAVGPTTGSLLDSVLGPRP